MFMYYITYLVIYILYSTPELNLDILKNNDPIPLKNF